jgi:hypothetical protein
VPPSYRLQFSQSFDWRPLKRLKGKAREVR